MDNKKALRDQYKNRTVTGGVYRIRCGGSGQGWLKSTADLAAQQSRFQFSVSNDSCLEPAMQKDWREYGASSFSFTVLEELEKKPDQTDAEFKSDIETLFALWREKGEA